jgi:SNF2 family DNA or RNA helicase
VNRYLLKLAKKTEQDKPHVLEAHKKLDENKGLIVHWGTGSGKTKFFLDAAKKALDEDKVNDALITAPASLVTNIDKELKKHNIKLDRTRLHVYSYEKANNISDELSKKRWSIAIADEAQKLRNPGTQRSKSLSEIFSKADKRVLATATANYNAPADIAPLINIAAGGVYLPTDRSKFDSRYIGQVDKPRSLSQVILGEKAQKEDSVIRKNELGDIFEDHVHYYDPKDDPAAKDKFPEVKQKNIEIEMDGAQARMYKFMEGKIPFMLRMKIRHNLPLDKQEKANLNHFSQGTRQVSNSHRHLSQDPDSVGYTPKIRAAVESMDASIKADKTHRGLVYSNYLEGGVHEYSKLLQEKKIKHGVFTGQLSAAEKDKLKNDYNSGKIPVLLISSSGAEGLDLKGTRKVQILEPHFNKAKIHQVVGRSARYESHSHLPPEKRNVEVEHYLATHPKSLLSASPMSIDQYLSKNSDDKQVIFDQIKQIMKDRS